MNVGIFAKTFARPSLEATLDAVRAHDLDCVQFNLACAGLPPAVTGAPKSWRGAVRRKRLSRIRLPSRASTTTDQRAGRSSEPER